MQTIDLLPGTSIDRAAALLVASAPARADFNGVPIRARYATTRPRDIIAHFLRLSDERTVRWRNSVEGKRVLAEQEAKRLEMQARADECMGLLDVMPLAEPRSALMWIARMAPAADRIGIAFDKGEVRRAFARAGWIPGANCGPDFNGEDARNFAGWIIGQWLACWWPGVAMFVDQWRAKFPES